MLCASSTPDTVGVPVSQTVALRAASCVRRLPSCSCSLRLFPRGPPCDAARLRVPPCPPQVDGRCLPEFVANLNGGCTYYMGGVDRHNVPRRARTARFAAGSRKKQRLRFAAGTAQPVCSEPYTSCEIELLTDINKWNTKYDAFCSYS